MDWTVQGFKAGGFEGFTPFAELEDVDLPRDPGIYAVFRPVGGLPAFLRQEHRGPLRGDPTVAVELLQVRGSPQHGGGLYRQGRRAEGPHRRYAQKVDRAPDYGRGDPKARHSGGRYLWQLPDSQSLVVAWKPTPGGRAREVERELIADFEARFGKLPFANINR